ncbi:hypothetical protein DOTSEDRAFT_157659 [Dothistroma septosporum NZE10]|uniref:Uncharacterized protein n=1 Tax=Dothistroma septosporum (strain NZE10 / CBS 128990) TaxID=675120 RepID=N1PEI3_DOTSN|nr:hypothetical protein DOTSEDRAFT_157659 [Dothistroma septosporum NZE10]
MSNEAALEALGSTFMSHAELDWSAGNDSTPYVNGFHAAMPPHPDRSHWHAHIQLLCHAQRLRHPNVNAESLMNAIEQMQLASLIPMEKTYIIVLVALLRDIHQSQTSDDNRLTAVFDLLEDMEYQGYNAAKPQILELLFHILVGPPAPTGQAITLQSLVSALGLARLRRQVKDKNMSGFWRTWHSYPRRLLARSKDMYTFMFDAVAEDQLQLDFKQARALIAKSLVDMEVEQPQVLFDEQALELAMSVLKALRHVDPFGEVRDWNDAKGRSEETLRRALNGT